MSKGKIVVLGVNGHIGSEVAKAFAAAGWDVSGMARTDKAKLPGVKFVRGDAESVADMRAAIGDADVVVNALNLPYASWDKGRKEAQMARVLEAMGTSGKTMLFPGNIYNYAATDRVVTPDLPQRPQTPRGEIQVRIEEMYRAAAERGDLQVIILRAGDFYSPDCDGDWFEYALLRDAKKGRIATMGLPGIAHSWAYLPDLARAFESLAAMRSTFSAFETFHFAGHFVTGEQMGAAIAKASPVPMRTTRFPLWLLKVAGMFDPMLREVSKMDYIWRYQMELRDERLDDLLGPGFATNFEDAVAATVTRFFPREAANPRASLSADLTRA